MATSIKATGPRELRGMNRFDSKSISARFQRGEIEDINQYCENNDISRSFLIHDAVMEYLKNKTE
jgi:hypothetical protein